MKTDNNVLFMMKDRSDCRMNPDKALKCLRKNCDSCGWNPSVAEERRKTRKATVIK